MDRTQRAYRRLVTRVTYPAAALVAFLLCGLFATLWMVADYQTAVAQGEQAKLARGAVEVRGQHVEKSALDYGAWDEAVEKLVVAPDLDWADENIGRPTFQNLGFDMSFVVAPSGRSSYGMVRGVRTDRPIGDFLSAGFERLIARQRADAGRTSTSGLILADGRPSIAAVVPIRPLEPDPADLAPRHLLVFVDAIDPAMLAEFGHTYLLPDLRLADAAATATASVPLVAADGGQVATLRWNGARPGDALLRTAVPAWACVAAAFGALTAFFLRQARSAARLIAESERRATHDELTGLPNRVLLFRRLDEASRSLSDESAGFAVAYLDLDGFKAVNDQLGHEAGDAVLRQVARRIRKGLPETDFAARLGGDEFSLLLFGNDRPQEILPLCRAIIAAIERPIPLKDGASARVSATIGVTFGPKDGADPLVLLRNADRALYLGKRGGKGQVRFHAEPVDDRLTA